MTNAKVIEDIEAAMRRANDGRHAKYNGSEICPKIWRGCLAEVRKEIAATLGAAIDPVTGALIRSVGEDDETGATKKPAAVDDKQDAQSNVKVRR